MPTLTGLRGRGLVLAGVVAVFGPSAAWAGDQTGKRPAAGRIFTTANMGAKEGLSLVAIDPETGKWETVFDGCPTQARVSPDGRTVVFQRGNDLWTRSVAGGDEPKQLVDLAGPASGMPLWSRDGKQVLLSLPNHDPLENKTVYLHVRVDVASKRVTEFPIPEDSFLYDWSADGTWIATRTWRKDRTGYGMLVMHPDGTGVRPIIEGDGRALPLYPKFSPDGRRLAYGEAKRKVVVVDADGKNRREVCALGDEGTMLGVYPCWSPDGARLAVHCRSRKPMKGNVIRNTIEVVDLDGRRAAVFELPDGAGGMTPEWR